ncbi:hypothetical protein DFR49_4137 [Hephaestia caeni]|uniref:Uncharacterized protein n=2 Tax=Hephaestia caeni TaxID=645617 RepID=A0A397NH44_9SPHN|nr:hypothetical protein DFR49_4137 [Hephaestia caeni]
MKNILILGVLAFAAGCGERAASDVAAPDETPSTAREAVSSNEPAADPAPSATPTGDAARASRYTSLSDCELIRERPQEAGFAESRCPGVGGYGLRLIDADARQNLLVERPGGGSASLRLSEVGGGGFSALGKTVEWRGKAGASVAPDAMIVRYNVVENPTSPGSETSYLMVASLDGDRPCITDKIVPGADQNDRARAAADADHACLP